MSLTLSAVLTAARDYSPFFDRSRIPDAVAARMASDVQRDLLAKGATRFPGRYTATYTTPAWPADTITLPAFERVLPPVRLNFADTTEEPETAPVVPEYEKATYASEQIPAYVQIGTALVFAGSGSDHTEYVSASVDYIAAAPDFVALTDALVLADDAKRAMVTALAKLFALRVNGLPLDGKDPENGVVKLDVGSYAAEAARAEAQWLVQQGRARQGQRITLTAGL